MNAITAPAWKTYQETAAAFFCGLGLEAQTDVTVQGVRTKHAVDVVVKSRYAGFEVTWLVECKYWNTKVTKLHVLALREIVADTGADRGILLAEEGFQSGALEAAQLTNVHLTSLANVQKTASAEIYAMRLRELYDRIEAARAAYWEISKAGRIECDLRPDTGGTGYSGALTIDTVADALGRAFRGNFPFEVEYLGKYNVPACYQPFISAEDVIARVEPLVKELEDKLAACQTAGLPTSQPHRV